MLHADNRLFRSLLRQPPNHIFVPPPLPQGKYGLKLIVPTRSNQGNTVAFYGPREVSLSNGLINTVKVCFRHLETFLNTEVFPFQEFRVKRGSTVVYFKKALSLI